MKLFLILLFSQLILIFPVKSNFSNFHPNLDKNKLILGIKNNDLVKTKEEKSISYNSHLLKTIHSAKCFASCFSVNDKSPLLDKISNLVTERANCLTEHCKICTTCYLDAHSSFKGKDKDNFCEDHFCTTHKTTTTTTFQLNITNREKNTNIMTLPLSPSGTEKENLTLGAHLHCFMKTEKNSIAHSENSYTLFIRLNIDEDKSNSIISMNPPKLFIVETEIDNIWSMDDILTTKSWIVSLSIKGESSFRLRITGIAGKDLVYEPILTDYYTVDDLQNQKLLPLKKIEIVDYFADKKGNPGALLKWESGLSYPPCESEIHLLTQENYRNFYTTNAKEAFHVPIDRLKFEKSYEIRISEHFGRSKENLEFFNFKIPECRDLQDKNTFLKCPPQPPKNIRTIFNSKSQVVIFWDLDKERINNERKGLEISVFGYKVRNSEGSPILDLFESYDKLYENKNLEKNSTFVKISLQSFSSKIYDKYRVCMKSQGVSNTPSSQICTSFSPEQHRIEDESMIFETILISAGCAAFSLMIFLGLIYFFKTKYFKTKQIN